MRAAFRTTALKAEHDQVKQQAADSEQVLRLLNNRMIEAYSATSATYCAACIDILRPSAGWLCTYCMRGCRSSGALLSQRTKWRYMFLRRDVYGFNTSLPLIELAACKLSLDM